MHPVLSQELVVCIISDEACPLGLVDELIAIRVFDVYKSSIRIRNL